ncbi:MAG TPA: metallophosphoesterase family protein [Candidatus Dormibacteraeota bacterium]
MRRLGLIGDTQGRYRLEWLVEVMREHFEDVDEVWHAGDWQDYGVLEAIEGLGKPFKVVNGNAPDDPRFPGKVEEAVEQLTLGMVHRPPRPGDAWTRGLDICIHGHTHRWRDETVGGTRFISVSTPTAAGFSQERTIGILTIDGRDAELRRIVLPKASSTAV